MGLNPEEWDHNYRKIPAKLPKCGGRLGVKEPRGHFRVETASQNIPSNLLNKKDSRDRLTCIPVVTAASKVLCLETRPIESGYRCNALGKQIPSYIPTFLNDQQISEQSKAGQGRQNATYNIHLAISNLVCDTVKYVNRETNTFTPVTASAHETTKTVAPTSDKQNLKI